MKKLSVILIISMIFATILLFAGCGGGLTTPPIDENSTNITKDEVWSGEIHVENYIFVPKGVTLTIMPGTVVRFKHYRGYTEPGEKLGIVIAGTLIAVGTPEN